jgi:DNA-3-methyladenine glycosylase I
MAGPSPELTATGPDGLDRCWWPGSDPAYLAYHDDEWGRPVVDDTRLFEKLCLEGFQAGLSWITILRKRQNFRAAFADFDIATVAAFGDDDVVRLVGDAGIVRHQGKIRSAINNARRALEVADEAGSLASYVWSWEPDGPEGDRTEGAPLPASTPTSTALSRDLKRRGWTFVGPTTVYAFMQAMGLVNDHVPGCEWRDRCRAERERLSRPG